MYTQVTEYELDFVDFKTLCSCHTTVTQQSSLTDLGGDISSMTLRRHSSPTCSLGAKMH